MHMCAVFCIVRAGKSPERATRKMGSGNALSCAPADSALLKLAGHTGPVLEAAEVGGGCRQRPADCAGAAQDVQLEQARGEDGAARLRGGAQVAQLAGLRPGAGAREHVGCTACKKLDHLSID